MNTYRDPSTGRLYRVSPKKENGAYVMQYRDPENSVIWKWCANWNVGNIYRESLEEVLEARAMREGWERVEDSARSKDADSPTDATLSTAQSLSAAACDPLGGKDTNVLTFDYSGLDDQTVADLHLAEREYISGRKLAEMGLRRMADGVAIAHDALCVTDATICRTGGKFTSPEQSFSSWCESIGLHRKAAERLLQVSKLMDESTPRQQKVLEELSPSLLYAAAKPSAPADLVQAVRDGNITTHKQYQEALAEIRARDAKIAELLEMSEAADRRADAAEQAAKNAQRREEEARAAAHKYHVQAEDIEAHRNALLDQQAEYITRIQELETRPVEVAVAAPNPAEVERLAGERAAEMTAQLSERLREAEAGARQLRAHAKSLEVQMKAGQRTPLTIANLQPMAQDLARSVTVLYDTFQLAACELRGDDYARCAAPLADALQDALTGLRGTVNERGANIYQEDEDFE